MAEFPVRTELKLLLEEFINEEHSFQESLENMKCDNLSLEDAHTSACHFWSSIHSFKAS